MSADVVSELLELAASDHIAGFRLAAATDPSAVHLAGEWYGRCILSSRMTTLRRTPLMVAAAFGSLNVLHLILSLSSAADVDRRFVPDAVTALHCAAAGGSPAASLAASLLLLAGADPNAVDAAGRRPVDLIPTPLIISPSLRSSLEKVLNSGSPQEKKKTFPGDTSIPNIHSGIYSSDEFRMFSFKIRPCSRAYSHDWTECPFVHPGENARRRDPTMFGYSCNPCVEFRRGQCPKGDRCEYAHGVFECWLHPDQYRTRLCKDGFLCSRRVCFFAHSTEDLRSLPNCRSPRGGGAFVPKNCASNLHSILSPRTLSSFYCVSSAEREKIEVEFHLQQLKNQSDQDVEIEPDLSWVQSLVGKNEIGKEQAILGAWLKQMQLDQKVVL